MIKTFSCVNDEKRYAHRCSCICLMLKVSPYKYSLVILTVCLLCPQANQETSKLRLAPLNEGGVSELLNKVIQQQKL